METAQPSLFETYRNLRRDYVRLLPERVNALWRRAQSIPPGQKMPVGEILTLLNGCCAFRLGGVPELLRGLLGETTWEESDREALLAALPNLGGEEEPLDLHCPACLPGPTIGLYGSDGKLFSRMRGELEKQGLAVLFTTEMATVAKWLELPVLAGLVFDLPSVAEEEQPPWINRTIPVIAVSRTDDMLSRLKAVRLGGNHFLPYPLDVHRLFRLLASWRPAKPETPIRILILGEEPLLNTWYQTILQAAGMEVSTLENPEGLLDELVLRKPEMVLLDLHRQERLAL
ncbi:MAG: response regulator, partial [Magnetococcales bacterium]|nr:response regulator [Magnetococcales bacterium]